MEGHSGPVSRATHRLDTVFTNIITDIYVHKALCTANWLEICVLYEARANMDYNFS